MSTVPTSKMLYVKPKAVSSPVDKSNDGLDTFYVDSSFEHAMKLLEAYQGKPLKDELIYA